MEMLVMIIATLARPLVDPLGLATAGACLYFGYSSRPFWWPLVLGAAMALILVGVVTSSRASLGLGPPSLPRMVAIYVTIAMVFYGIGLLLARLKRPAKTET